MNTSIFAKRLLAAWFAILGLIAIPPGACLAQTQPTADASAPTAAISLPAGLNDVVKLTKAGMSEDIILTQIKGLGPMQLTTDQIIYLSNVGVSQNVIKAIVQAGANSASNPPVASPAAPAPASSGGTAPPPAAYPSSPSPGADTPAAGPPAAAYPSTSNAPAGNSNPPQPVPPANPPSQYAPPAPPPPPALPSAVSLAVPANVEWVDTGVDVATGDSVTVSASGTVRLKQQLLFIPNYQSPNGNPQFPSVDIFHPFIAPGLAAWSLIGKVSQNGAAFEIGSSSTFAAPSAGRLYLSVNANGFDGNSGNWNVTLSLPPQAQPEAATAAPPTPPSEVNFDYFHEQLAPYGNWVQVGGYGWCWSPAVAVQNPGWRPYADQGQWVYTDTGLFWQSAYPWGDIAFHYGRWTFALGYGWLWIPDYTWGPSWVCWRHAEAEGLAGWAPLPPGATFVPGVGLMYNGALAVDIDFGMPAEAFVFVGYDHLWDHDYRGYFVPRDRVGFYYGRSYVRNGYRVEGGRFKVEGLGRERLGAVSHHEMREERAGDLRQREEREHFESRRSDPAIRRDLRPGPHIENKPSVIRKGPAPMAKPAAKPTQKPDEKKP